MKDLTHTGCGGEVDILFVHSVERYTSVEMECRKCKKTIMYEEGGYLFIHTHIPGVE